MRGKSGYTPGYSSLICASASYRFDLKVSQDEYADVLVNFLDSITPNFKDSEEAKLVRKTVHSLEIKDRYLACDPRTLLDPKYCAEHHVPMGYYNTTHFFTEPALEASRAMAQKCMDQTGILPHEITGLVFVVPGLLAPHPIYRLGVLLNLETDVDYMQYTAGGCVFGMTGYARAHDHLRLNPSGACLVIAVEVNSGMFMGGVQKVCREAAKRGYDGFSGRFRGQLLTTALFGDLVAASLLIGPDQRLRNSSSNNILPALIDHHNLMVPNTTDHVGMEMFDEGYMGYLTTKLVKSAPQALVECAQSLIKSHGLQRSDIKHWVLHPGGPAILKAVAKLMDLSESDVIIAQEVYSEIGNVAACTAIEIMRRTVEKSSGQAEEGEYILGLAAGYGVIAHGCLFRWERQGSAMTALEQVASLNIQSLA